MDYRIIEGAKVTANVLRNNIQAVESEHAALTVGLVTAQSLAQAEGQPEDLVSAYTEQIDSIQKQLGQKELQLQSYYEQLDALPKSAVTSES